MLSKFQQQAAKQVAVTKDIVDARQKRRAQKDGDLWFLADFESFIGKVHDPKTNTNKNVTQLQPPAPDIGEGKNGQYRKKMSMYARITQMPVVPQQVQLLPGGVSWRVLMTVKCIDDKKRPGNSASEFLKVRGPAAWAATEPTEDDLLIRDYISREGDIVTQKWHTFSLGDKVKVKAKDPEKNGVFRHKTQQGAQYIQAYTPIKFHGVKPIIYLGLQEKDQDGGAGATEEDGAAIHAPATGAVIQGLVAPEAPPPAAAVPKIKTIVAYPSFECDGEVIVDEDYRPNLSLVQRLREQKNPDAHQMVPVALIQQGRVEPPYNATFLIQPWYETAVDENYAGTGICLSRNVAEDDPELVNDYRIEIRGEVKPNSRFRFSVWHTHMDTERLEDADRYIVEVRPSGKDAPDHWRHYGITHPTDYGLIMQANSDVPVWAVCKWWRKNTVNHPENNPDVINNKPELANVRGYYYYILEQLEPCLEDYLPRNAFRVDAAFLLEEFDLWASTSKRDNATEVTLKPRDATVQNPLNVNKLNGAVVALGNGYFEKGPDGEPLEADRESGINHAYDGKISSMLKPGAPFEFYVLTSISHKHERYAEFARGRDAPLANDFLRDLIDSDNIKYWIYAVRTDAPKADEAIIRRNRRKLRAQAPPPPTPAPTPIQADEAQDHGTKRPRGDTEAAEVDDEEDKKSKIE